MGSQIHHFKNISIVDGDIEVQVNVDRFTKQFNRAQFYLDSQIMTDMTPLMPHVTGTFVDLTKQRSAALAGTGRVCAAAPPYGRYLYMGKVMVDPVTKSAWARKGAKKITTEKKIAYGNPNAVPQWFDEAKRRHGRDWIEEVKRRAGGGK